MIADICAITNFSFNDAVKFTPVIIAAFEFTRSHLDTGIHGSPASRASLYFKSSSIYLRISYHLHNLPDDPARADGQLPSYIITFGLDVIFDHRGGLPWGFTAPVDPRIVPSTDVSSIISRSD